MQMGKEGFNSNKSFHSSLPLGYTHSHIGHFSFLAFTDFAKKRGGGGGAIPSTLKIRGLFLLEKDSRKSYIIKSSLSVRVGMC